MIPTEVQGDVANVAYPTGEMMKFAFSEESIAVYSGTVALEGDLDGESLVLVYQACDDTRCLSPVERRLR